MTQGMPPSGPGDQGQQDDVALQILGYESFRAPQGYNGQGLLILTNRGNIFSMFHPTTTMNGAVIWMGGASGGVAGPAEGIYNALASELAPAGIASLQIDYRFPNVFYECALDALAAAALLEGVGFKKLAMVGHSFGGAVAIGASVFSQATVTVIGLSSQSVGTEQVASVAPRPLLLVHGTADTVIPPESSDAIYQEAGNPKEFKLYEGAGHSLKECKDDLRVLLKGWLTKHLSPSPQLFGADCQPSTLFGPGGQPTGGLTLLGPGGQLPSKEPPPRLFRP
ncbi:MAG: alpha/beta hydrolase [Dehalococcoidia bacterium]|nr:alpha/beta hydrolase [Dehalococcoidia bacterium]